MQYNCRFPNNPLLYPSLKDTEEEREWHDRGVVCAQGCAPRGRREGKPSWEAFKRSLQELRDGEFDLVRMRVQ